MYQPPLTALAAGFFVINLLPPPAWAEPAAIEEIIVSAARTGQPASAIPGTVQVLEPELIRIRADISDDLASVLASSVPGFAPSSQKLAGRGETLRGRNPLYLIDGVPQHNALRDGQRDGHTIDLDFVERIEIINGSNAIQGVGATGGVINIRTREPLEAGHWQTEARGRISAADDLDSDSLGYKFSLQTGRRFERVDLVAGLAWHERGLFFDHAGDPVGLYPTQGDIMDSTSLSFFGKGRVRLTDSASLTLLLNHFDLERNGDFRSVAGNRALDLATSSEPGDPGTDVGDPARNEITTVALTFQHEALWGGRLESQFFYNNYSALFEGGTFGGFFRLTPGGDPFLDQSDIVSEKLGLKTSYNRSFWAERAAITLGLDLFRDDSAQELARSGREWVPETRFDTLAPFVQFNLSPFEPLTLVLGGRIEDARLDVDDYTTIASAGSVFVRGGAPDFRETLHNAGLIWQVTDGWRLYAAASEGFTMPDVGRVLRAVSTPGASVEGLLDVEPVVTDNLEVGLEFDRGPWRARLTYFQSTADNGALLSSNAQGIFEVERQRTEIDGFEVSVDYRFSDALALGANYSATEGRFDSDGVNGVDTDLDGLNIGPDRLNVYADGRVGEALRWRTQVSHLADRNFRGPAAPAGRDFDGYVLVDLFVGWRTGVGEFSLAVENLLNEDYFTYFAQTEPAQRSDTFFAGNGRTLSVGWRTRF